MKARMLNSPISPLDLLLSVAFIWRLSSLFVNEHGPLDIFERLRDWAGLKSKWLSGLLDCLWCFSLVSAIVYSMIWLTVPDIARVIALPFALSTGAIVLDKLIGSKS